MPPAASCSRSAPSATEGTDQATERLTEAAQTASSRLGASHQELHDIAGRTEATLTTLGANITQQTASLSVVHDQIGEQFQSISNASENQRSQLLDLFDKLGAAHGQASDVADRTITRLTESLQQIQRQLGALSDQSQSAIANVRTAGSGFADQAGAFLQNAQQAEQQARTVLSVTAALQDQARQLREALHNEGDRTNELLSTLLGKISTGGTELRDLGTTAELTLTSLQNGVTQQTQTLNATMQQIGDRQRSLTVALDAQRDVVNGLLNRLALAQDETAATAERTVARLTDSTQQIAKQLIVIDQQAQTTLANVQSTGAQFADEAGTLSLHAQQAEQQMRAVLSVTAGMQEQARSLRESMQGETARVIEQLTGIIAQLDAAGGQLKQQSGAVIHVLDQSALHLETVTRNSGEQLQKHGETLASAATQAEDAHRRHRRQDPRPSAPGRRCGRTERTARPPGGRDDRVRCRLHHDFARQHDGKRPSRPQCDRPKPPRASTKSRAALQNEVQRLLETSQNAAHQVSAAAQNLSAESDSLRANLASSESALAEAARLVRDESVQLPATLDRSTSQIEAATERPSRPRPATPIRRCSAPPTASSRSPAPRAKRWSTK